MNGSPPHARGRRRRRRGIRFKVGSPPHARGRQESRRYRQCRSGITPACAGKTLETVNPFRQISDHPRMRGEDVLPLPRTETIKGSPPHARGRLVERLLHLDGRGITPACAGKTNDGGFLPTMRPDHPRMRGEDSVQGTVQSLTQGSPPHARGRHAPITAAGMDFRITPACAGKTPSTGVATATTTDHPRMRGEDWWRSSRVVGVGGSPPHARGRRRTGRPFPGRIRITPACAGKTSIFPATLTSPLGSPPHARGRLDDGDGVGGEDRITPACAGKTLCAICPKRWTGDHPRMRGEDPPACRATSVDNGSPPHARGRPVSVVDATQLWGITPACAGKT